MGTQETLDRLQLLYQRTLAGASGGFDADDLAANHDFSTSTERKNDTESPG